MNYQDTQIGQSVVRIKGNEAVGRTGEIIDRHEQKNRVRVAWKDNPRTWVTVSAIEPSFIPYEIIMPAKRYDPLTGKRYYPIYKRKSLTHTT